MGKQIKTGYQSEIDEFFHDFDKNRTQFPKSRHDEIKKHDAIFKKRDHAVEEENSNLWEGF